MVGGQAVDIESEGKNPGEEIIGFIHLHKTGALIAASVKAGAIFGRRERCSGQGPGNIRLADRAGFSDRG